MRLKLMGEPVRFARTWPCSLPVFRTGAIIYLCQGSLLEESVRFELTEQLTPPSCLANNRNRPLCQLSPYCTNGVTLMVLRVGFAPTKSLRATVLRTVSFVCLHTLALDGADLATGVVLILPRYGGHEGSCTLSCNGFKPSVSAIAPRNHLLFL